MTNDGGHHFIGNLNSTVAELNALDGDLTASVKVINGEEWLFQENFKPSRSYLPSDYDQTAPLAHWKTQNPTGLQLILQLESTQDAKKVKVTSDVLKQAVTTAINDMALKGVHDIQTFESFGDGVVMSTVWNGGSLILIVLWDGRSHIDVNLFTFVEDVHIGITFEFFQVLPSFQTMLRDEQPRGTGNVVAYKRDLRTMMFHIGRELDIDTLL
ncbi:hypothetical protein CTEN210_03951 [Chaetoceros tenuissimus]|uniref:Uncharacterized protein n=1 Tax=Chaetoceros tenuissimus TaxID=426638 RepID=A0AAD3H237_9STRA|nr:hypothetical protein CTEN210_03951 [Chaetoceros tenuissimus]